MLNKLIFALAICIPSNLLADFRGGHGGWGHGYDCDYSNDPDCVPHCHDADDELIDEVIEKDIRKRTGDWAELVARPRDSEAFSRDYLVLLEMHKDFFKKYRRSFLYFLPGSTPHNLLTKYEKSECEQMKNNPKWPPLPYDFLFRSLPKENERI